MVRCLLVFALVLLSSLAVAQAPEERDGEDFAIYLQSVGGPVTVDLCASVLPEPDALSTAFSGWLARNKVRAEHGRALALTKKSESELQSWEALMSADFREKFAANEQSRQKEICLGFQKIFAAASFK